MGQYRKKPVVVEAVRFDGCEWEDEVVRPMFEGSFDVMPEWLIDAMARDEVFPGQDGVRQDLSIVTLEGTVTASPGDFIIRGTAGEIYPCKPDIFRSIYDAADEAAVRVLAGGYPDVEPALMIGRLELGGTDA